MNIPSRNSEVFKAVGHYGLKSPKALADSEASKATAKSRAEGGLRWSRSFGQSVKVYANGGTGGSEMAKRRRFTPGFKAQVALEALREERADSATDRGAARGACERREPVEAQGARRA